MTAPSTTPAPTTDPRAIGAFWDAMIPPRAVGELRVIRKDTGKDGKALIDSAYFDSKGAFVDVASRIQPSYAAGCYLTMNEVDPHAPTVAEASDGTRRRPFNKDATVAFAGATTRDEHILTRRHLLVDVDAANKPGTSATDEERAAALAKRDEIRDELGRQGWPAPRVETSSGNGGGLIYDIDLPNDESSKFLVKRVLEALDARFTTPSATVDVGNSNASRITRIPGTVTAKGEHTPERPWRRATAEYPEGAGVVTRAQLEALAAEAPRTTRSTTARATADGQATGDAVEGDDYAHLLANGSPAGERHQGMTRLLGHYIALGLSTSEVQVLGQVWADRCSPPVPHHEVDATIRDLAAAEARKRARPRASAEQPADQDHGHDQNAGPDAPPLTPAALADALRTQRAALQSAYATIETLKAANAAKTRLLLSDAFSEGEKKLLVFLLQRLGCEFGAPLPESFGEVFIPETEMSRAGLCVNSFRTARKRLVTDGVLIERLRQPSAESASGHPYTIVTVNGERLAHLLVGLDPASAAAAALTEARAARAAARSEEARARFDKAQAVRDRREEQDRAHRQMAAAMGQERRKHEEEADRLAVQLMEKAAEAEAMRRAAADAQREAARIVAEAQAAQWGQRESLPCGGCGTLIAVKDWRCDDCRAVGTTADQFTGTESVAVQLTPTIGAYSTDGPGGAGTQTVTLPLAPIVVVNSSTIDPEMPAGESGKLCRGGCGAQTPPGISYCGVCRLRPLAPLPIATRFAAGQGVRDGR